MKRLPYLPTLLDSSSADDSDSVDEMLSRSVFHSIGVEENSDIVRRPDDIDVDTSDIVRRPDDIDVDTPRPDIDTMEEEEEVSGDKRRPRVTFPGQDLAKRIKHGANRDRPSMVLCVICQKMQESASGLTMDSLECSHSYCISCIVKHISKRIQGSTTVPCPGTMCEVVMDLSMYRDILQQRLLSRWQCIPLQASYPKRVDVVPYIVPKAASSRKVGQLQLQEPTMAPSEASANLIPRVNPAIRRNTKNSASSGRRQVEVVCSNNVAPKAIPTLVLKQCDICAEERRSYQMLKISDACLHTFCSFCVSMHIKTKVADNQVDIPCLGLDCKQKIQYKSCAGLIRRDVLQAWDRAMCESLIPDAFKVYCPFRDCSAMLVNDTEKAIQQCECPHCHRQFCAQCNVPWHDSLLCSEFRSLNQDEWGNEDLLVKKLAREMRWGRCPQCKYYIERTDGCHRMKCRCKFVFCYRCGNPWTTGNRGSHLCCTLR